MIMKNFKRPKNEKNAIVLGKAGSGKVFSNIRPEEILNDKTDSSQPESKMQTGSSAKLK